MPGLGKVLGGGNEVPGDHGVVDGAVFDLVGFDRVAGDALINDISVLKPIGVVRFHLYILCVRLLGSGNLIFQLDIIVPLIRTQNGHVYISVSHIRFDLHRVIAAVAEFEVRAAPTDGGIHTVGNVGRDKTVIGAGHNLHIRNQSGIVQG